MTFPRRNMLFLDERQAQVLALALSMLLATLTEALSDEEDTDITPDELADLMDTYATAGVLWSKTLRIQGVKLSEIRENLMNRDRLEEFDGD